MQSLPAWFIIPQQPQHIEQHPLNITINNLEHLIEAEITFGDLTVICGTNNSGKTYLSQILYEFLFNTALIKIPIGSKVIDQVLTGKTIELPLDKYKKHLDKKLDRYAIGFPKDLTLGYGFYKKMFVNSRFRFKLSDADYARRPIILNSTYTFEDGTMTINTDEYATKMEIQYSNESATDWKIIRQEIDQAISMAMNMVLFGMIPKPFFSGADRLGRVTHLPYINYARNVMRLRHEDELEEAEDHVPPLIDTAGQVHSIATRAGIHLIDDWQFEGPKEEYFLNKHPEIADQLSDILGGEIQLADSGLITFIPNANQAIKLDIPQSSGSVRSLVDISVYLRHYASKDESDIIFLDKPEASLHPENQRKIARLLAQMVNAGIKLFITTHSEIIIQELSNLIMLSDKSEQRQLIASKEGYAETELLSPESVRAYTTVPAMEEHGLKSVKRKLTGHNQASHNYSLKPMAVTLEEGITDETLNNTSRDIRRIRAELLGEGA